MVALAIIVVVFCVTVLLLTYIPSAKLDPEPPRTIPGADGNAVANPAWDEWQNRNRNGANGFWGKLRAAVARFLAPLGGTKTLFWLLLLLVAYFVWRHRAEWPKFLRRK